MQFLCLLLKYAEFFHNSCITHVIMNQPRCRIGKFLEAGMGPKWFRLNLIMLVFWIQASAGVWAQSGNVTAFVHVNLVPMTAETIIPDQTVLVRGVQIIATGPSNRIDIPEGSTIG